MSEGWEHVLSAEDKTKGKSSHCGTSESKTRESHETHSYFLMEKLVKVLEALLCPLLPLSL